MTDSSTPQKNCPLCRGSVALHATYCYHCKQDFDSISKSSNSRLNALIVIGILAFIGLGVLLSKDVGSFISREQEKNKVLKEQEADRIAREQFDKSPAGQYARMTPEEKESYNRSVDAWKMAKSYNGETEQDTSNAIITTEYTFTIKAVFGNGTEYEAFCHDISEECVLISGKELQLYKTVKYSVVKLGRRPYVNKVVHLATGVQRNEDVYRMTFKVQ
jgi:hypothetical protein